MRRVRKGKTKSCPCRAGRNPKPAALDEIASRRYPLVPIHAGKPLELPVMDGEVAFEVVYPITWYSDVADRRAPYTSVYFDVSRIK